jgi:hypothetical protein
MLGCISAAFNQAQNEDRRPSNANITTGPSMSGWVPVTRDGHLAIRRKHAPRRIVRRLCKNCDDDDDDDDLRADIRVSREWHRY